MAKRLMVPGKPHHHTLKQLGWAMNHLFLGEASPGDSCDLFTEHFLNYSRGTQKPLHTAILVVEHRTKKWNVLASRNVQRLVCSLSIAKLTSKQSGSPNRSDCTTSTSTYPTGSRRDQFPWLLENCLSSRSLPQGVLFTYSYT